MPTRFVRWISIGGKNDGLNTIEVAPSPGVTHISEVELGSLETSLQFFDTSIR